MNQPRTGIGPISYPERRGKPYALNRALAAVDTPVVVFADVRQEIEPRALRYLVARLLSPGVGAVSGELWHRDPRTQAERKRKVRTLTGNFQAFARHPWLLSPPPQSPLGEARDHRLPHGYMGERDYRMEGLAGYGSDGWTIDSGDWRNLSATEIYTEVVQQLGTHPGKGQIILMHDGVWQNGRRWPEHSRCSTLTALVKMFATLSETDACVTMTEWEAAYGRKYPTLLSNYR